ncbi:MAG: hypothetical protein MUQ20_01760 [Deltaproteobacteria bacterium]|nr:hypothetical protein [Deltaproteobacteria bacterium]
MTYTKIFLCCLCCLMLCVLGIAGCTNGTFSGSNSSSCSDYGTGGGYSIKLCVTGTIIQQGGQTTLIASVRDAQGNPVNDSTRGVSFTSSMGATITAVSSITLGSCSTTYTAPSATTQPTTAIDQVTASYQGAFAYVSIEVYKP